MRGYLRQLDYNSNKIHKEAINEKDQNQEEIKQPLIQHLILPSKVDNQCYKVFPYKSTYKRHLRDLHNDMPRLYLKHQKKDGKYVCEFCEKPQSHTRDLKVRLQKNHNLNFVFIHEPAGKIFLFKRKSGNPAGSLIVEKHRQVKNEESSQEPPSH